MTNISRAKFERLMAEVAEAEDRVADLEKQLAADEGLDPQESAVIREELKGLMERMAKGRSELSRISDGCGKPHPMS